jgi:hypothetical protein
MDKYIFSLFVFILAMILLNEVYSNGGELSDFTALGALIAAIAASITAWFSFGVSNNAYKLAIFSNRPHLDLHFIASTQMGPIQLKIKNCGGGPGILLDLSVNIENVRYDFFNRESLVLLKDYFDGFDCTEKSIGGITEKEIIPSTGELLLLSVSWPTNPKKLDKLKNAIIKVDADIRYLDINDEEVKKKLTL